MSSIYLTEQDVEQLLDMDDALEVVEEAFRQMAARHVDNIPRRRARSPGIQLHSMSAAAEYLGLVGWKQYTTTRQGARFLVGVYESATGQLEAIIEGDRLGQLRTGAATGIAIRHLGNSDASDAALIGCGWQAESQLEAAAAVRKLQRVRVYCRDAARRQAFADKMSERLALDVVAAADARMAVSDCPIVVTATTSRTPVVPTDWVADGAVVCAVGSNATQRAELDAAMFRRAARVVCDDVDACRTEAGELIAAVEQETFNWSHAVGLAKVVAGTAPGRSHAAEVIVFKSVGLAIEDLAVASRLIDKAKAAGVGHPLPL